MRKILCFLCVLLLGLGIVGVANATLYDRGNGLIYDDVLDITWLQDANYANTSGYDGADFIIDGRMYWADAVEWADQLVYQGYTNWRLPATPNYEAVSGYDGSDTVGWNVTTSEMGYMYYVNLRNLGYKDTDGNTEDDWGLLNTSFESGGEGGATVLFQFNIPSGW